MADPAFPQPFPHSPRSPGAKIVSANIADAATDAPVAAATRARARRRRRGRTTLEAYLLIGPSLFGFLAFLVAPVVIVFVLSLFSWNLITSPQFVGLANYRRMFTDSQSWHALLNTAYYVVLNIPLQTVLALLLALALNRKMRGSKFFRVIFVLPWMAMPVALGVIWNWFFDPRSGIIDHVISMLGFTGPNWLTSTTWAMPVIASVNVWQYTGYTISRSRCCGRRCSSCSSPTSSARSNSSTPCS